MGNLSPSLSYSKFTDILNQLFLVGAPIAGKISDYLVVKYRAQRGGVWYPEDRLRGTLIGAGVLVPLSILFSGLLTQFVPGKWGLIANMVCLFVNGLGVRCIRLFCLMRDSYCDRLILF